MASARRLSSKIYHLKSAFTLIELLVVISIIGILAAISAASYTKAQQKARDGKRKADIKSIQQALELYFQTNGHYPPWDPATGNEQKGWCTIINSSTFKADVYDKLVPYINPMPKDPAYVGVAGDYFYKKSTDIEKAAVGQYQLGAVLENSNDPDRNTTFSYSYWSSCTDYSTTLYPNGYVVFNP